MNLNNKRMKELFMLYLLLFSKFVVSPCNNQTNPPVKGIDISGWAGSIIKLSCTGDKHLISWHKSANVGNYVLACSDSVFIIKESVKSGASNVDARTLHCFDKCNNGQQVNTHFTISTTNNGQQKVQCDNGYQYKHSRGYVCDTQQKIWFGIDEIGLPIDITDICVNCREDTSINSINIDVSSFIGTHKLTCVTGKVLRRKNDSNIDVSGYKLVCVGSNFKIHDSNDMVIQKDQVECVAKCPDKTSDSHTNARNSHFRNSIDVTGKQTVECDEGYHPKSKQGYKCSSTGNWQITDTGNDVAIAEICVSNCSDDHSLDSIKIDVSGFSNTRKLTCQEGYDLQKKDDTTADISGYQLVCVGSVFQIQDSNSHNAIIPKAAVECVSKCKGNAAPADGIDVSGFTNTRLVTCVSGYDLQKKDDTSADISGYQLVCVGSVFQIQDSNSHNAIILKAAVECVLNCKDKKDDEAKESHFTISVMQDGTQTVLCDEGYQKAGTKEYVCVNGDWRIKNKSASVDINNICIKKMTSAAYSTTLGFLFVFSFVVFGGLVF